MIQAFQNQPTHVRLSPLLVQGLFIKVGLFSCLLYKQTLGLQYVSYINVTVLYIMYCLKLILTTLID